MFDDADKMVGRFIACGWDAKAFRKYDPETHIEFFLKGRLWEDILNCIKVLTRTYRNCVWPKRKHIEVLDLLSGRGIVELKLKVKVQPGPGLATQNWEIHAEGDWRICVEEQAQIVDVTYRAARLTPVGVRLREKSMCNTDEGYVLSITRLTDNIAYMPTFDGKIKFIKPRRPASDLERVVSLTVKKYNTLPDDAKRQIISLLEGSSATEPGRQASVVGVPKKAISSSASSGSAQQNAPATQTPSRDNRTTSRPDASDLCTITGATRDFAVSAKTLYRAIKGGILTNYRYPNDRCILLSRTQLRVKYNPK